MLAASPAGKAYLTEHDQAMAWAVLNRRIIAQRFREAIGAGLRYHLPFGPIRIDYGYNPNRRMNEQSGFLHVTVGFAF